MGGEFYLNYKAPSEEREKKESKRSEKEKKSTPPSSIAISCGEEEKEPRRETSLSEC